MLNFPALVKYKFSEILEVAVLFIITRLGNAKLFCVSAVFCVIDCVA